MDNYVPDGGDVTIQMLNSLDNITIRSIRQSDYTELKQLHDEFFPIRYNDDYFTSACQGIGMNDGRLSTCIAECSTTGQIAGFLFYQFIALDDCDDQGLIADSFLNHLIPTNSAKRDNRCVSYVLILGCRPEWRRVGLASHMMAACIEDSASNNYCVGVYVHVIHYNISAIKFYDKNNFQFLRTLDDFYVVSGRKHEAYLYIYYVNGNRSPLLNRLWSVMSKLAHYWVVALSAVLSVVNLTLDDRDILRRTRIQVQVQEVKNDTTQVTQQDQKKGKLDIVSTENITYIPY